jgi:hypothetical protein
MMTHHITKAEAVTAGLSFGPGVSVAFCEETSQSETVLCPVRIEANRIYGCGFQYKTFLFQSKGTINRMGDECIRPDKFDITSPQVNADGDIIMQYGPCKSQFSNCDAANGLQ